MRVRIKANKNINLYKILLATLLILFFLSLLFLIRSDVFVIKSVDVNAKKINCADVSQIRNSLKILGQNFFFINSSKIEGVLKRKYLCIKEVEVSRFFPDKVKLQVFGREPTAILVMLKSEEATPSSMLESFSIEGSHGSFLVDTEGIVYSTYIEQVNAPKIYFYGQDLILGQKIKGGLISDTLKILEKLKTFGVNVNEVRMYSEKILLVNATPKIYFKLDDKIDIQLASLQLILNQAKIDEEKIEFIDLRFDKPIVKFAPKKTNG